MSRLVPLLLLVLGVAAASALAEEPKKKGDDDPFGDLFGDSLGGSDKGAGDLKDLTKDVHKEDHKKGLKPKSVEIKDKATISLVRVFAAERIRMHPKRGCEPADRDRTKVTEMTVEDVPSPIPPFAVCLTLSADAYREMRITTTVVSPKNRKIGRAESVVDFRGKPTVDHIMTFPSLEVKQTGQYFYAVDIDGKPAGRLPLFEVKKGQVE